MTVRHEAWMARKLELPLSWAAGVTTAEQRKERIRAAIREQGREYAIAGKRPGQPAETWGALFERVYGEPFSVETQRRDTR